MGTRSEDFAWVGTKPCGCTTLARLTCKAKPADDRDLTITRVPVHGARVQIGTCRPDPTGRECDPGCVPPV
jgi:hypothetical protein